ncbi:MAG TPA: hypothetical protein PLK31_03590, partial [Chloroflexota bacterium]|nr:hypothetical protein [Chloroflexota bacterium]
MSELRLLIVADDPLARAGLSSMLATEPGCEVIGQINSTDVIDEMADAQRPDVVIWDVGWEIPEQIPDWVESALPMVALLPPFLPDGGAVRLFWDGGIRVLLTRESDGGTLAAAAHTAVHHFTVLDNAIATLL